MSLSKFINDYFFKVRNIMAYNKAENYPDNVEAITMADISDAFVEHITDSRLKNYIVKRMGNSEWTLFLYRDNDKILGYSFIHAPLSTEWLDSLPTTNQEARLSGNFVYPEHRGKGICSLLLREQIQFARNNGRRPWSVIESTNTASLRSNMRSGGKITRKNYLVKIWKRNILSVLTKPLKIYVLIGKRRWQP